MRTAILKMHIFLAVISLAILLGGCDPANRIHFKNTFGDEVQVVITTVNNQYKGAGLKPNDELTFFVMLGFYPDEEINWGLLSKQILSIQVFDKKGNTLIDARAKEGKLDSSMFDFVQTNEDGVTRNILVIKEDRQ